LSGRGGHHTASGLQITHDSSISCDLLSPKQLTAVPASLPQCMQSLPASQLGAGLQEDTRPSGYITCRMPRAHTGEGAHVPTWYVVPSRVARSCCRSSLCRGGPLLLQLDTLSRAGGCPPRDGPRRGCVSRVGEDHWTYRPAELSCRRTTCRSWRPISGGTCGRPAT